MVTGIVCGVMVTGLVCCGGVMDDVGCGVWLLGGGIVSPCVALV